ncbi:MAG: hypothetical protein OXB84_05100 [Halobacteriovoraceae bacterium]|nr:hypothetical protein [Halobacteriovoraceae bacterium]
MKSLILFMLVSYGEHPPAPEGKIKGIYYLKNTFGHIHQNPSIYSSSITTVSCGHPIKVYISKKKGKNNKWERVKAGAFIGYIKRKFLVKHEPSCFQDKYPRFFEDIGLESTDIYYWGRLYDQYISKKTKVKK